MLLFFYTYSVEGEDSTNCSQTSVRKHSGRNIVVLTGNLTHGSQRSFISILKKRNYKVLKQEDFTTELLLFSEYKF